MTTKEYLSRHRHVDKKIKALLTKIATLKETGTSITSILSDMPRGNTTTDKVGKHVESITELEEEVYQLVDETCRIQAETLRTIMKLQDNVFETILIEYWLNNKKFKQICKIFPFSEVHAKRLHGIALIKLQQILDS